MTDNLKKFLEAASSDEALKNELQAFADSTSKDMKAATIEFAAKHGFTLTEEDFESSEMEELTEDELEAVAGGVAHCGCGIAGGGAGDGRSCGCGFIGIGSVGNDPPRIVCVIIGVVA